MPIQDKKKGLVEIARQSLYTFDQRQQESWNLHLKLKLKQTMRLSGRIIGLLKEYMHDLVEQAKQEEAANKAFGYASQPYRSDQAISDLMAILDDRIESEGVQVGLPVEFLHEMWTLCNEAGTQIRDEVWLKKNLENQPPTKARVRELTYQALIEFLEASPE